VAPLAHLPGARALAQAVTGPLASRTGEGPDEQTRRRGGSLVVAIASDADGRELAQVHLHGPDPYTLTARLLAWGAHHTATSGALATGALGPVDAFGLATLQTGAATAGLKQVDR
jgi:short subunit dehydrogenase-like uncharacterized protein